MKKSFALVIVFFFAAINILSAQSKGSQKKFVSLGGIESGSTVSIMQVLDYPVLVLADKNEKVLSYEISTIPAGELVSTTSYKVEGAKLNQNALNELNAAKGKKGKIFIENIIVTHDNINVQEKNMIFYFQ